MIKEINEILEKTYSNPILRRTTVPLLMSSPGCGKSTIVEEFAKKKGVKLLTTILSTRMPNEICGGLMPDSTSKSWEMYDNGELLSLVDNDIWFIDEVFNGTLKSSLDALLNVLQGRALLSGKKLANIAIVAASNPQGLISLTPQIRERFIMYDLKFNPTEYQEYLKYKYGMDESVSKQINTLINKEKFDANQWNFHSPRSIEKAINQIGCDLKSPYDDFLLPILKTEIELERDYVDLDYIKGTKIEYLKVMKHIIQKMNQFERDGIKIPEEEPKKTRKPRAKKIKERRRSAKLNNDR